MDRPQEVITEKDGLPFRSSLINSRDGHSDYECEGLAFILPWWSVELKFCTFFYMNSGLFLLSRSNSLSFLMVGHLLVEA